MNGLEYFCYKRNEYFNLMSFCEQCAKQGKADNTNIKECIRLNLETINDGASDDSI